MLKLIKAITKPPSPEIMRLRMIEETARNLLQAESTLRNAEANREQYARLLAHLKSVNFQGLTST